MKNCFLLLLLLAFSPIFSQIRMELTPQGFPSQVIAKPSVPSDKLIESVRNWVATYNEKNEYGYDITEVSESGMTIDAYKRNAFFYRNKGEAYQHRIRYTMVLEFTPDNIKIKFAVKEIYDQKKLLELAVADFFRPDGKLKADYLDAKPSLEKTVNGIVNNFAEYMSRVTD
ncbi:hypothetical protein HUK80_13915 [Flavobacterium sp. MAH-1]|uniref:DUF4468 domain-containing protein n=1 Tax=Flavobacterium agri TaxID=2743471 RepID=A0A7Y8Y662_9FLAO|nr:hypothetical protein [Flavobacterium agri]NUY81996.1 hypothetical protein [Flavobacterium agri]NYA72020.1 hypothetical protein [Flavobacterium agri]